MLCVLFTNCGMNSELWGVGGWGGVYLVSLAVVNWGWCRCLHPRGGGRRLPASLSIDYRCASVNLECLIIALWVENVNSIYIYIPLSLLGGQGRVLSLIHI